MNKIDSAPIAGEIDTKELLEQQYELLGHYLVDGITEIRLLPEGKQIYVKSHEEFVNAILPHKDRDVYVGVNPRKVTSGLARSVSHVTSVVFDVDPANEKGVGSSEEQLRGACELGSRILKHLGRGVRVSSGSGSHIWYPVKPVEVKNVSALSDSIRAWGKDVAKKFETPGYRIDSIYDLPRVIRVWGTYNTKSKRICHPEGYSVQERADINLSQEAVEEESFKVLGLSDPIAEARFHKLVENNATLKKIVSGTAEYPSRSEADFAFAAILYKAHFTPQEIFSLSECNPIGSNGERGIEDVIRICAKVASESSAGEADKSYSLRKDGDSYFAGLNNRRMGIPTGMRHFDEMVSGLKPGKLYVFAARPNEGKTSLAVQIADNIAKSGKSVLFYPTEIGAEPIFDKILSRRTGINLKKFQNGTFSESELGRINSERFSVSGIPLVVIEDFSSGVDGLESDIRRYSPSVMVYDYFQASKWKDPDSVGEKASAVRKFKELAKKYDIPVLLFSQLKRSDGKASMSHLKGTGELEELADVAAFLTCENKMVYPRRVNLEVIKSKYSATGVIGMSFKCSTCLFEELEVSQ